LRIDESAPAPFGPVHPLDVATPAVRLASIATTFAVAGTPKESWRWPSAIPCDQQRVADRRFKRRAVPQSEWSSYRDAQSRRTSITTRSWRGRAEHAGSMEAEEMEWVSWKQQEPPTRRSIGWKARVRVRPATAPARQSGRSGSYRPSRAGIATGRRHGATLRPRPARETSPAASEDTDQTA
jgi:hypothetical protein